MLVFLSVYDGSLTITVLQLLVLQSLLATCVPAGHILCAMFLIKMTLTGVPWTEEEHRRFLLGLQKLGKGDWRGISRNFVVSRTPTQVASHAQKYFIRQSNMTRRKRRSSLFDMVPDEVACLILFRLLC